VSNHALHGIALAIAAVSAPRFSCASTMRRLAALSIKREAEEDWGREKMAIAPAPWPLTHSER